MRYIEERNTHNIATRCEADEKKGTYAINPFPYPSYLDNWRSTDMAI